MLLKRHKVATTALLAGCLGVVLCAGGCAATAGIGSGGGNTPGRGIVPEAGGYVVVDRQGMIGEVEIIAVKSAMAGDVRKAEVLLRISPNSKEQDMVPLQYRFDWLDAQGREIPSNPGAWAPMMLFGRATQTIHGMAPEPRAREFRLKIRGPDGEHC